MEYTKDVIFKVNYNNVIKEKWTSRILGAISRHKVMTTIVILGITFIAIDMFLISNFFKILTMV